ncbi:MAG TPA: CvpA family protein [Terracidiphilus sp.]|jgi:membrane protein required for colicin V production
MTPVDWAVIAILVIACLAGLAEGFFRSVCGLGGLILGLAVAAWNYHRLAIYLLRFLRVEAIADTVAFLLIFLLVLAIAAAIGHLLARAFRLIGLGWLDSLAGGAFGLVQGAVIITVLILVAVAFFPQESHWIAEAQLPRQFFAAAHVGSNITPSELGDRVRSGLNEWENKSPEWLHPGKK